MAEQESIDELKKCCGVYLIISPSGGRYVGSSTNIFKRWNRYKNLSCHSQPAILNSLKKYGPENHSFAILFNCGRDELLFWERVFGDIYLASVEFSNGLNITLPGYDNIPQVRSKEFRDRVSQIQKNRFKDPNQRKITSIKSKEALNRPEIKKKLSEIHKKRFENPELRKERSKVRKSFYERNPEAKLAASEKTKEVYRNNPDIKDKCISALKKYRANNPDAHSKKMKELYASNPVLGQKHSEKLKQYYTENPEARKLASERSKKQFSNPENNVRCKKVIDVITGEVFASAKILASKLNKPYNTVCNWLNGRSPNPTHYKYQ